MQLELREKSPRFYIPVLWEDNDTRFGTMVRLHQTTCWNNGAQWIEVSWLLHPHIFKLKILFTFYLISTFHNELTVHNYKLSFGLCMILHIFHFIWQQRLNFKQCLSTTDCPYNPWTLFMIWTFVQNFTTMNKSMMEMYFRPFDSWTHILELYRCVLFRLSDLLTNIQANV